MIPVLLIAFGIYSCKKDVNPVDEQSNTSVQSGKASPATQGTTIFSTCENWRVSSFTENGTDLTNNFTSMLFAFCPDNIVTASNDILAVNGSWLLLLGKGGSTSYLELNFNPLNNDDVSHLTVNLDGMWKITKMEQNEINLQMDESKKTLVFIKGFR